MPTQTHRKLGLNAVSRAKSRRRFEVRVDVGTGLVVVLGLLVAIQLIARG